MPTQILKCSTIVMLHSDLYKQIKHPLFLLLSERLYMFHLVAKSSWQVENLVFSVRHCRPCAQLCEKHELEQDQCRPRSSATVMLHSDFQKQFEIHCYADSNVLQLSCCMADFQNKLEIHCSCSFVMSKPLQFLAKSHWDSLKTLAIRYRTRIPCRLSFAVVL